MFACLQNPAHKRLGADYACRCIRTFTSYRYKLNQPKTKGYIVESLTNLFAIGFGFTSLFLWFSFFRMIRKNLGDPESKRRTAVKALLMLGIALSLQLVARQLPRFEPHPFADMITFMAAIAIWAGVGMFINYKVTHNHPVTSFQHKVNVFTAVVMIASVIWAPIPYIGFVFLPAFGLALDHSLLVTAVASFVYAIWQQLE